jgi:muconolactone delta-isomerase
MIGPQAVDEEERMEYMVVMTTHVPDGTSAEEVDAIRAREAANTRELAARGEVLRLWRPPLGPGEWRTVGLFHAEDEEDLERVLAGQARLVRLWKLAGDGRNRGHWQVPDAEKLESLLRSLPMADWLTVRRCR